DRAPRGIRLVVDPGTNYVKQLYYVEQPEDYIPNQARPLTVGNLKTPAAPPYNVVSILGPDRTSEIQAGDYLELFGVGQPRRILAIAFNAGLVQTDLAIAPPLAAPMPAGVGPGPWRDYRIIRAPRVTAEDPTL